MSIRDRLYISTIGSDAPDLAREHSLGLELADFCMASNMDRDFTQTDRHVRQILTGVSRLMLHAPFSEMCPAAIDPLVRKVTLIDIVRQSLWQPAMEFGRSSYIPGLSPGRTIRNGLFRSLSPSGKAFSMNFRRTWLYVWRT